VLATLRALADGRVRNDGGRVVDGAGHALTNGLDLTQDVESAAKLEIS
jgi:hypothetical protein